MAVATLVLGCSHDGVWTTQDDRAFTRCFLHPSDDGAALWWRCFGAEREHELVIIATRELLDPVFLWICKGYLVEIDHGRDL